MYLYYPTPSSAPCPLFSFQKGGNPTAVAPPSVLPCHVYTKRDLPLTVNTQPQMYFGGRFN